MKKLMFALSTLALFALGACEYQGGEQTGENGQYEEEGVFEEEGIGEEGIGEEGIGEEGIGEEGAFGEGAEEPLE